MEIVGKYTVIHLFYINIWVLIHGNSAEISNLFCDPTAEDGDSDCYQFPCIAHLNGETFHIFTLQGRTMLQNVNVIICWTPTVQFHVDIMYMPHNSMQQNYKHTHTCSHCVAFYCGMVQIDLTNNSQQYLTCNETNRIICKLFTCTVYVTTGKQRTISSSAYPLYGIYSKPRTMFTWFVL